MTINNLELALQLNNNKYNQEINLIITYINQFATNNKISIYNINNTLNQLDQKIDTTKSEVLYSISLINTNLTETINNLADDYGDCKVDYEAHKADTDIHITATEREQWNNTAQYTDGTVKSHAENLTIHVTQADKDLWNATLQNAKDYAKNLFDQVTSFNIVVCQSLPTQDIQTMTIYFLQISAEQNDLYEEYMYIDGAWEKIGNTRIDLSDYVTTSMLQSAVNTINQTITNKETSINNTISALETKHDNDVLDLQNDINDIQSDISDVNQDISDLETKHDNEVLAIQGDITSIQSDINDIQSDISDIQSDINDLASDIAQDLADLSTNINNTITTKETSINNTISTLETKHDNEISGIQSYITNNITPHLHDHTNKSTIDKFSEDNNGELFYGTYKILRLSQNQDGTYTLDAAILQPYAKTADLAAVALSGDYNDLDNIPTTHTHSNKSVLDNLTQTVIDNSHTHSNKSVLDNITQTMLDNSHSHTNSNVLNLLSADAQGNLLYNGNAIGGNTENYSEQDVTSMINELWPSNS